MVAESDRAVPGARVEVVAIFGPTGSGKSAVAELVAETLGTEVVSADALQVYRGIPIVTNQPTRPTRLVGIRGLDEQMSVGEYARLAHSEIDDLLDAHGVAVVAGGTGLYLRAALVDLAVPPPAGADARARVEAEYDADPETAFHRLVASDPLAAERLHPNDRRRVVRALELTDSGHSLRPVEDRLWSDRMRRRSLVFGLDLERDEIAERILRRAEEMLHRGAADEARAALAGPTSRTAEKALGLRELAELPEADALARLAARTRRYASYQRKWMRRIEGIRVLDATRSPVDLATEIVAAARAE